jgi:hypothetical protein
MTTTNLSVLLQRVQIEFVEMPGMKLTLSQAGRLWNLPTDECAQVLSALVEQGFLRRTDDGAFLRRDSNSARATAA